MTLSTVVPNTTYMIAVLVHCYLELNFRVNYAVIDCCSSTVAPVCLYPNGPQGLVVATCQRGPGKNLNVQGGCYDFFQIVEGGFVQHSIHL